MYKLLRDPQGHLNATVLQWEGGLQNVASPLLALLRAWGGDVHHISQVTLVPLADEHIVINGVVAALEFCGLGPS